ncbi:MAG: AMP-dependent synthetase/ligase [Gammaproteobacteria bacterium]
MTTSAHTVLDVLETRARRYGSHPALRARKDGRWQTTSWSAYHEQVMLAARGLMSLGLEPGAGVVIMAPNSPRWFLSAIGAIAAGGVPAGIYTTNPPEQCFYIAEHSDAVVAIVQDNATADLFLGLRARLPRLKAIVAIQGSAMSEHVYTWETLLERAAKVPEERLRARMAAQQADDVCSLIYTSGTTGSPKGVMIRHRNIVWNANTCVQAYAAQADDAFISYLPLSHIAEQLFTLHVPMAVGACTWFAQGFDTLADDLREARPSFFLGVPRVWEKIQSVMQAAGADASLLRRQLVAWARRIGLQSGFADQDGLARPRSHWLAEQLVFAKVRRRLGLDRARCCFTSAAPISRGTLEFFLSLGIPILEAYGMSECSGPATVSYPDRYRLGKAGVPLPGTELRLAEDGEILIRGPHVFLGYYKDDQATQATLDDEGWLHSGDIGTLDEHGFLAVTDRKKDMIITSGGENIAPQPVEMKLREIPGVAHAILVGDRRKYVTALLALDLGELSAVAARAGSPARVVEEACRCPIFRQYLEQQVDRVNLGLAHYSTIKRFAVLPEALTIDGGELTPTMKLRRRLIGEKYAAYIKRLYT